MRRPTQVELMLLTVIALWSLNLTVSRYVLTNGLLPLAYATVRYGLAALVFVVIVLVSERTLRIARGDVALVVTAVGALWVNQLAFVYALDTTSASVLGLVLGATPIFAALIGLATRTERLSARFWLGGAVSFVGVGLVALGSGAEVSGDVGGVLLGVATAATWAGYSAVVTRLMRRYSPSRISAVVLAAAWVPLALTGSGQTADQDWALGAQIWALVAFAVLGPLVLTNVLWFRSLDRIGPARATLATNLQPFVAAVLAVVLLGERLAAVQVLGGALIALGIVLARRRRRPPVPVD